MRRKLMYRLLFMVGLAAVGLSPGCTSRGVGGDENNNNGSTTPWTPPVEELGQPGWRGSTEPWSPGDVDSVMSFDIWSNADGVYVLHTNTNDCTGAGGCSQDDYMDCLLSVNDGTGWQTYWTLDEVLHESASGGVPALTGFPDGRLLFSGGNGGMGDLMILTGDVLRAEQIPTYHSFVVNDQLAYAATDREEKLIRWNGQSWEPVPAVMPYTAMVLWADADVLFAAGDTGTIMSMTQDVWTVHDTGTIEHFTALWGFGADDVWAGTVEGSLFHYDGSDWSRVTWPMVEEWGGAFIKGMWGRDGVLFLHTDFQLVRHDASGFTNLGAWPCTEIDHGDGMFTCEGGMRINAMWGNSPEELFLAVDSPEGDAGSNENIHLLWFDGTHFHWF